MTYLSDPIAERARSWCEQFEPLVLVERGRLVEAVHRGAIVVVEPNGRLAGAIGSPDAVIYLRSSAKPLQALPVVSSGAADHFGFSSTELAVMAGSHAGSSEHVEAVQSILVRIGLNEGALECGVQMPFDREARAELIRRDQKPRSIQNNCSGKHAAMLALACYRGYPTAGYYLPEHPVQREILGVLSELAGWPTDRIALGVDGCGVPVFGLPLWASARAFARLANPDGLPIPLAEACRRVVAAMATHPIMVSGRGRLCTVLLGALPRQIVAKGGAEGFYAIGVTPGRLPGYPEGLGVILKIEDGETSRAVEAVAIEVIRQLGLADESTLGELYGHFPIELRNFRQEVVGSVRPIFRLKLG